MSPPLAILWACALLIWGIPTAGRAEQRTRSILPSQFRIGWQGQLVLGSWTPVVHTLDEGTLAAGGTYRLDVIATDPDGNLAVFPGEETSIDAEHRWLSGRFQLGRPDGQMRIRVYQNDILQLETGALSVGMPDFPWQTHTQAERLLITVGLPDKLRQLFEPPSPGKRTVLHYENCEELPDDDLAYDGVAGLFLAGTTLPNASQSAAIHRWVQRGGKLYLSIGTKPAEFAAAELIRQLPFQVEPEPVATRELTSLEAYVGKTVRILPPGVRLMIPRISSEPGKPLAGGRGELVLLEAPHALGTVTLLGLDVTQLPLRDWSGTGDLLRKMTDTGEYAPVGSGRKQQFGSTGVTEIGSQISGALEHFEPVRRISPWWILAGLLMVMALIGPLDYWLVDRVWKRPLSTWVSFPVILALCAMAGIGMANNTNGRATLLNQLDVVDLDAESGVTCGRHWATLYSPHSRAGAVQDRPTWPAWSGDTKVGFVGEPPAENRTAMAMLGWSGLPEGTFGGMYRPGAGTVQFGQAEYEIDATAGQVHGLPMAQWSTSTLSGVSQGTLSGLVESNLVSSPTGRLSGTVLHRLPGPLTDWFLVFSGRIYRMPAKDESADVVPLEAKKLWRVDQPQVVQRELRGYLTRTTAREVRNTTEKNASSIVLQQANYDPLSRSLAYILPIASFHSHVGGTSYTGLTNDMLSELDLTSLMDLDRALLIGFLDQPASELTLAGEPTLPGQRTTMVRIVLPVARSKQPLRELPRVIPENK